MIFFGQFKVPTIKFGKCFAEFMIPIALLKKQARTVLTILQFQDFKGQSFSKIFIIANVVTEMHDAF